MSTPNEPTLHCIAFNIYANSQAIIFFGGAFYRPAGYRTPRDGDWVMLKTGKVVYVKAEVNWAKDTTLLILRPLVLEARLEDE